MADRFIRLVRHWLIVLFAATFAFVLLQPASNSGSDTGSRLMAFVLLGYVTRELVLPVWKVWKRWKSWHRESPRPELPTPAQWVSPREQRRRNREVR